ncbi:MAG: tetratricopeptide repeat protein, partial [Proteobacteria bacterium]
MNPKSFKFAFAAVFASVASAAVAGIAQEARAAGEASGGGAACIDEKAKQSLSSCPNGPSELKSGGSNKTGVSFKSVAPLAGAKKDNKPGKPDIEQGAAQRDERTSKLKARQKQLLITEIQGIESLFQGTPKNAPDRPQLARRLAESYVELEAAAFRDKTNAEVKRDELKKKNPQAAGQQQTQVNASDQVAKNARKNAIKYYTLVVKDYPNYPALDEVLYYLAYEYEQAGDNKNARRVYLDLINSRPKSKYIPNAYLAFGELFF